MILYDNQIGYFCTDSRNFPNVCLRFWLVHFLFVLEDDLSLPPSKYSSIQSNASETVNPVKDEPEADGKISTCYDILSYM